MGVQQMWLWAGRSAWELPLPLVSTQPTDSCAARTWLAVKQLVFDKVIDVCSKHMQLCFHKMVRSRKPFFCMPKAGKVACACAGT